MKPKFRPAKMLLALGMLMFALLPARVLAHDNLGGDELSMSGAMLIGAIVVTVMAVVAGIWAWRAGQFANVEDSKYRMLDIADNYDEVMAEADLLDARAKAAESASGPKPGHRMPAPDADAIPVKVGAADGAARA